MVGKVTRPWIALDVGSSHVSHVLATIAMQSTLSVETMCTTSERSATYVVRQGYGRPSRRRRAATNGGAGNRREERIGVAYNQCPALASLVNQIRACDSKDSSPARTDRRIWWHRWRHAGQTGVGGKEWRRRHRKDTASHRPWGVAHPSPSKEPAA